MASKQSAANNEFLRAVKAAMNRKVYAETLRRMNTFGEKDAIGYVQQYFNQPISIEFLKLFVGRDRQ